MTGRTRQGQPARKEASERHDRHYVRTARGRAGEPAQRLEWGLALLLTTEQAPGMRVVGSGAWAGVFNTRYCVDRASDITGATYSQFLPFIPDEAMTMYADYERALYAAM